MVKPLIKRIPIVVWISKLFTALRAFYWILKTGSFRFIRECPPGRYDSPIPDSKYVLARESEIFARKVNDCPGVNLRKSAQLELLKNFSRYYSQLPFRESPTKHTRYYYDNRFFSYGDAIILYAFLRHYKPKKIVEVGSGFSSSVMLDVNDLFLGKSVKLTFIEPYPKRLFELLTPEDKATLLQKPVQDVPLKVFSGLSENDILFVDSSHVVKIGSDVRRIFFDILPVLKPGVIIHFHDVFWPFEYPKEWFLRGQSWNEDYFLRAFLQYNAAFEIMYFNSYLSTHHRDAVQKKMPLCLKNPGGSLWLRKVA